MLKIYGGVRSRASIVVWYLEELGIPYEYVMLNMENKEHLQPEFLEINPIGKVPAIVDGDLKLWESGAILMYLAQKYGNMPTEPEKQAIIAQWILFANSTLATGMFVETVREKEMPRLMTPLNQIFKEHPFILGEEFSVADVAVGALLAYIPIMLKVDLSEYPEVVNYTKRLSERPAFQKAMAGR